MKVIPETCRVHQIWYLRFSYNEIMISALYWTNMLNSVFSQSLFLHLSTACLAEKQQILIVIECTENGVTLLE
jgi:hypothetical protein